MCVFMAQFSPVFSGYKRVELLACVLTHFAKTWPGNFGFDFRTRWRPFQGPRTAKFQLCDPATLFEDCRSVFHSNGWAAGSPGIGQNRLG